jgi:hypothetical protein
MDFVGAARRVGDRKHETFFAGNVRQGFGMISFTSGGGAAGANFVASAQAVIAMDRMIFFIPIVVVKLRFAFLSKPNEAEISHGKRWRDLFSLHPSILSHSGLPLASLSS